jgi:hypothetical protein
MADNTVIPPGAGGDTIRTMDRGTSKTQVVGLDFGPDAGPENLVAATNGLPVAQVSGASWTVAPNGGAFAVTNAGLTNIDVALSTRLKPADTLAGVTTVGTVTTVTNPVTVAQATPANLQATVTPAAGQIFPVSGTFFQATQPISNVYESITQSELLSQILVELRTITYYLMSGLNVPDDPEKVRQDAMLDIPHIGQPQ